MSINNGGMIVGWYVKRYDPSPYPYHGFILKNNTYWALDYRGSDRTMLNDINNLESLLAATRFLPAETITEPTEASSTPTVLSRTLSGPISW